MQVGRAEDAADVAELAAAAQGVRPCPRTVVAVPGGSWTGAESEGSS